MHLTRPVPDHDLAEALRLLTSPVFPALSLANAAAGYQSDAWQILHTNTPRQIVDEVIARSIDVQNLLAACSRTFVVDTPVLHMILEHDPRPKCLQCGRRHYVDKRTGEPLSCGDTQQFRNPPPWHWTRASAEAAL